MLMLLLDQSDRHFALSPKPQREQADTAKNSQDGAGFRDGDDLGGERQVEQPLAAEAAGVLHAIQLESLTKVV
jgi:hypothetical protein